MDIYKLMAAAFIILTPLFAFIIVKFFRLGKLGLKSPDLALPLFAAEIVLVSAHFFVHSLLPYYLIVMSLLAIALTFGFIHSRSSFSYRRFCKFFWRAGFILTFIFYLGLVILIFTL
ncbi:DUF3397 domain-containing protein [Streptococcus sp. H31]|uniref:DUF3397 domain-containing protein n=1 Tax=Streptococcus huangxiaojuni TaxID=3237239 RepID=UPI0034A4E58B